MRMQPTGSHAVPSQLWTYQICLCFNLHQVPYAVLAHGEHAWSKDKLMFGKLRGPKIPRTCMQPMGRCEMQPEWTCIA
jgi:hypothetical protein